jgi:hypothetical protein
VVTTNGVKMATVHVTDSFVEVQGFSLATLAGAALLQRAVDTELLRAGLNRLLVDATEMAVAPTDVNEYMWRWAQTHPVLKRIAVVNQSPVMSLAVQRRAAATGQRLEGFQQRAEAIAWLCDG